MLRIRENAYVLSQSAARKRNARANETVEQRTERQKKDADRKRQKRATMTDAEKAEANKKHAENLQKYRKEGYAGPLITSETAELTVGRPGSGVNFTDQRCMVEAIENAPPWVPVCQQPACRGRTRFVKESGTYECTQRHEHSDKQGHSPAFPVRLTLHPGLSFVAAILDDSVSLMGVPKISTASIQELRNAIRTFEPIACKVSVRTLHRLVIVTSATCIETEPVASCAHAAAAAAPSPGPGATVGAPTAATPSSFASAVASSDAGAHAAAAAAPSPGPGATVGAPTAATPSRSVTMWLHATAGPASGYQRLIQRRNKAPMNAFVGYSGATIILVVVRPEFAAIINFATLNTYMGAEVRFEGVRKEASAAAFHAFLEPYGKGTYDVYTVVDKPSIHLVNSPSLPLGVFLQDRVRLPASHPDEPLNDTYSQAGNKRTLLMVLYAGANKPGMTAYQALVLANASNAGSYLAAGMENVAWTKAQVVASTDSHGYMPPGMIAMLDKAAADRIPLLVTGVVANRKAGTSPAYPTSIWVMGALFAQVRPSVHYYAKLSTFVADGVHKVED